MNSEFMTIIEYLEKDKGIEKKVLLEAVASAIRSVAVKTLELEDEEQVQVEISPITGKITVLVNGQKIETSELGRIAAQTAKQVIMQKMKEAETEVVYDSFKDKAGELVNGVIQRFDHGDILLEVGRAEAILAKEEQVFRDNYKPHDRLRAYVLEISKTRSSLKLIVSRSHPDMVRKLFEFEVPEISEGTVEIKGVVREAGDRTKIAVYSDSSKIDCVGACVGMRGSRVKNIVNELRGEKIDIVRWDEDPEVFIRNALSPAEIVGMVLDKETRKCQVTVDKDKLSLAIGKKGQNARLAAKLTGWDIDIVAREENDTTALDSLFKDEAVTEQNEEQLQDLIAQAKAALLVLDGVDDSVAEALVSSGFNSAQQIAQADVKDLMVVESITEELATQIIEAARKNMGE